MNCIYDTFKGILINFLTFYVKEMFKTIFMISVNIIVDVYLGRRL